MNGILSTERAILEEFKAMSAPDQVSTLLKMAIDPKVSGALINKCREYVAMFNSSDYSIETRIVKNGRIIRTSKNLRGMREYARVSPVVKIETMRTGRIRGSLRVIYRDGAESRANFASYQIMIDFVRNRRSWAGAEWDRNGFEDVGYLTKPGTVAGGA